MSIFDQTIQLLKELEPTDDNKLSVASFYQKIYPKHIFESLCNRIFCDVRVGYFGFIPLETLIMIMDFLTTKELIIFTSCCKILFVTLNSEIVWKNRIPKLRCVPTAIEFLIKEDPIFSYSWKNIYVIFERKVKQYGIGNKELGNTKGFGSFDKQSNNGMIEFHDDKSKYYFGQFQNKGGNWTPCGYGILVYNGNVKVTGNWNVTGIKNSKMKIRKKNFVFSLQAKFGENFYLEKLKGDILESTDDDGFSKKIGNFYCKRIKDKPLLFDVCLIHKDFTIRSKNYTNGKFTANVYLIISREIYEGSFLENRPHGLGSHTNLDHGFPETKTREKKFELSNFKIPSLKFLFMNFDPQYISKH